MTDTDYSPSTFSDETCLSGQSENKKTVNCSPPCNAQYKASIVKTCWEKQNNEHHRPTWKHNICWSCWWLFTSKTSICNFVIFTAVVKIWVLKVLNLNLNLNANSLCFKTVHLLQLFSGERCHDFLVVKLQKCFVDFETSPDCPEKILTELSL